MQKRPCHLAVTIAICASMAGDNRRLLSGGTQFLAIYHILFSRSVHLAGAAVVIFSIDWHNSFIWDVFGFDLEAGLPLVPSFIYTW